MFVLSWEYSLNSQGFFDKTTDAYWSIQGKTKSLVEFSWFLLMLLLLSLTRVTDSALASPQTTEKYTEQLQADIGQQEASDCDLERKKGEDEARNTSVLPRGIFQVVPWEEGGVQASMTLPLS